MDQEKLTRVANKEPIQAYMALGDSTKEEVLSRINLHFKTNYGINHLNNWISGRKPVPKTVRREVLKEVINDVFGHVVMLDLQKLL